MIDRTAFQDDSSCDDEPAYGSFPEEQGEPDLIGLPYDVALKELGIRYGN